MEYLLSGQLVIKMKWLHPKIEPVIGETRERKVFAWLPAQVGDYRVWLEFYIVEEIFTEIIDYKFELPVPAYRWVEKTRYLAYYMS